LRLDRAGHESEVRAAWLIDCTGRKRWLARRVGARPQTDDHLLAFVAPFTPAAGRRDSDAMTLVESTNEGWWYTLRIPNRRRIVAYLTDAGTETSRIARSAAGFKALLEATRYVGSRLAAHGYQMASEPRPTAAGSARLERATGRGWLAAGDACASFDPLSSQGLLTAIYSGLKAGRALAAHLDGEPEALAAYEGAVRAVYTAYLENRARVYRSESRWPQSEFWRRRRA